MKKVFCLFLCLFLDGLPKDITGPFNGLLVCVGVHSQSDGFITMPQLFRNACHVCAVGYGNAGEGMAQLVGVKVGYTIPC